VDAQAKWIRITRVAVEVVSRAGPTSLDMRCNCISCLDAAGVQTQSSMRYVELFGEILCVLW
jgi:hypothetical protein